MTRRLTIDDFVGKARLVHGSRYDYSGATYVNSTTKITIGCEVHGPFEQTPSNHLTGFGCRKCGLLNAGQYHKKDTAKFIEKARAMHGERYDYSRTVYRGAREDVTIICRKHGEYQQNASIHLNSKRGRETSAGCPACSYEECAERQRMTLAEFLQRAADAHGRTYDYRLVESTYESAASTVSIICPDHGVFQKLAANHIAGQGCPVCAWARTGDKHRKSTEAFIGEAHRVHEHRYDYSLVDYQGAFKRVSIICPIDGPFAQSPTSHLRGIGCPKCSRRAQGAPRNLTRALRGEFDDGRDAFVYMLTFDLPGLDTTLYKVGCGTGSRVRTLGNDIKRVGGRIRGACQEFCV